MAERASMVSALRQRKVLLCVGPGGVGKTTCAASIALAAAQGGRKVVVVTIDPSRRLAQALGLSLTVLGGASSGEIVPVPGAIEGEGELDALILHTQTVFDDIVRACSVTPERASNVLENRLYQATAQRLGGALEYAAMARLQMLHASGDYDLVVLDTPPTANAIDFLEAPDRVREMVSNPVARLLAGTGKLGVKILGLGASVIMNALRAIGGGKFIAEFGEFLRDFSDVLAEFHRRAGSFDAMLASPDTGVVLATSATEFSIREAREFLGVLRERDLRIDGVVLNRGDPEIPAPPSEARLRSVFEPLLGGSADAFIDGFTTAYAAARVEGARAERARHELERNHPGVPILVIPRQDPPPTTLGELGRIGRALLGEDPGARES